MNNPLALCLLTGLCFGSWPVVARWSGFPGSWIAVAVAACTLVVVGFTFNLQEGQATGRGVLIVLAAGTLNGLGMIMFGKLLGTPGLDASKYIPIVYGMLPAVSMVGMLVVFRDPAYATKFIGLALVCAGVWLINR